MRRVKTLEGGGHGGLLPLRRIRPPETQPRGTLRVVRAAVGGVILDR
jgi:hypothetical protein